MKYISHIKDLVSGIIDNDLVTKDTEAYKALVALKNHLDSLKEIHKYMPYQDPGPVIRGLEQGLAQANTRNQELKEELNEKNSYIEDLKKQTSEAQCDLDNWVNYKGPELEHQIGILEQKLRIAESILTEEQKTQYQEQTNSLDLSGNKSLLDQKQDEISFLKGLLSYDQEQEYYEYLRTQLPDDQPQYKIRSKPRFKKRRAN